MPVERYPISISQFAELLAIDPARFVGVEVDRPRKSLSIVIEPEVSMSQTSGTCPPLTTGKKPGGKKKR